MFELFCKISFFVSMLVMYAYVTSTREVLIIIFSYIICVFSYYYFSTIKTVIDKLLNNVHNLVKSKNINSPHVPTYAVSKKYNKVNSVVIPPLNKVFVPVCRPDNAFSGKSAVFNCKLNRFISNEELSSPMMKNGLTVRSGHKSGSKYKTSLSVNENRMNNSFGGCKKYNNALDVETLMNVKSPGFISRIVDKASESASYHIKYPAVKQISTYRFDKSTLRHLSKIPRINSTPVVRIAPPEPISINLLNNEGKKIEKNDAKEANFLQVLKDISRKRNFSQEEIDKNSGCVKKSRRNDIKNFAISQYKRSLEDKSEDKSLDKSKKRCDYDRNVSKISYTSNTNKCAISSNLIYKTNPKKRKSKEDKLKNESLEKIEKFRKIDETTKDFHAKEFLKERKPKNYVSESHNLPSQSKPNETTSTKRRNERPTDQPIDDDNLEYVRVVGGKILNRTNCLYRRKLNSKKIDAVSVIASEPEIAGEISNIDDSTMKHHLIQNLLSDIERKGERDEKVIFYKNSIIEEVGKHIKEDDEGLQQVPNLPVDSCAAISDTSQNCFANNNYSAVGDVSALNEIEINNYVNGAVGELIKNGARSINRESSVITYVPHSTLSSSNAQFKNFTKNSDRTTLNSFGNNSSIYIQNDLNTADSGYDSLKLDKPMNTDNANQNISYQTGIIKNSMVMPSNDHSYRTNYENIFSSELHNAPQRIESNLSFGQISSSANKSTERDQFNCKFETYSAGKNGIPSSSTFSQLKSPLAASVSSFNAPTPSAIKYTNSFSDVKLKYGPKKAPAFDEFSTHSVPSFSTSQNSSCSSNNLNCFAPQESSVFQSSSHTTFGNSPTSFGFNNHVVNTKHIQFGSSNASRSVFPMENGNKNLNFETKGTNLPNFVKDVIGFNGIVATPAQNTSLPSIGNGGISNSTLQKPPPFQFGSNASLQSNQPFVLENNLGSLPNVGFCIGSGVSSKNRNIRDRRNK